MFVREARSGGSKEDGGEWSLYWVRPAWALTGDEGDQEPWADLRAREQAAGIEDGSPILIDPAGTVDPRLARFFGKSRFSRLASGTREAYVKDYRLWFTFLWARGRYWDEASPDDIDDYEAWRRRAPDNPRRIGGAKWARELAAFVLLYDWAVARGHMTASPISVRTVRSRDGGSRTVAESQPTDVRSSNVKWVTPRTFRLWCDVGLRGCDDSGLPEPGWRGRNDGRNLAFAQLLFTSGLRLREAGCLLTLEVPDVAVGSSYYEGHVAAAIAKRRERMFYLPTQALGVIRAYQASSRRGAVAAAQRRGRYERISGLCLVTDVRNGHRPRLRWRDGRGRVTEAPLNALDADDRRRLFIETDAGLEPLALWLTEDGMPMRYASWGKVFTEANHRCERFGVPVRISPHTCRHSFALTMLIALQRGLDARFGLTTEERDHLRSIYGNAFALVKDLLGHSSEETTRRIYLEPLTGIRLAAIMDDTDQENTEAILAHVAERSRLVLDVPRTKLRS